MFQYNAVFSVLLYQADTGKQKERAGSLFEKYTKWNMREEQAQKLNLIQHILGV